MKVLRALVVVLLCLILLALALPFVVDLDRYQDQYRPLIERALNRQVSMGKIRLTIIPRLGANIEDVNVMDDPAFGADPFLTVASVEIGVKLRSLLVGRVDVAEIVLDQPAVTIVRNARGQLNVSTLGKTDGEPAPDAGAGTGTPREGPLHVLRLLAVETLSISSGMITYRDQAPGAVKDYALEDLVLNLESLRIGETPTLHLSTVVQPFKLPVRVDGSFGPLKETLEIAKYEFGIGIGNTPISLSGSLSDGKATLSLSAPLFNAADLPMKPPLAKPVHVKNLQLDAQAPYPLPPGVPASEAVTLEQLGFALVMGNSILTVKGSGQDGVFRLSAASGSINTFELPVALPLKMPVEAKDVRAEVEARLPEVKLTRLSMNIFGGTLAGTMALKLDAAPVPFETSLSVRGIHLGTLVDALLASPITVSGSAVGEIDVRGIGYTGPDLKQSLSGTGHLSVTGGKVEGVNLMREAVSLVKGLGLSADPASVTTFDQLQADFHVEHGVVHLERGQLESKVLMANVMGTVGLDQSLNLRAKVTLPGKLLTVPMLIGGTTKTPTYTLDQQAIGGNLRKLQQEAGKAAQETIADMEQGRLKPKELLQQGKDSLKKLFGE